MLTAYAGALVATVAAQIAPGPNLLAVASVALSQGRLHGVLLSAGIASGVLLWVALFALGVSIVFEKYPVAGLVLQILGGAYFLWIGARALFLLRSGKVASIKKQTMSLSIVGAWRRGLLVVITNPKAAIMWATVTTYLTGAGLKPLQVFGFAPIGASSAFLIYGAYAVLFSTPGVRDFHQRCAVYFDALFGLLFSLIGLNLLYTGIYGLSA